VPSKSLYMESTEIHPAKSAAEVSAVLIGAGAIQIATDYDNGRVTGLRWVMRINDQSLVFSMPARVEPIYKILMKRASGRYLTDSDRARIREKAERVAWRQLLRWAQAQVAMIEVGMVQAHEVFFPYLDWGGKTVFARFEEQQFKMLNAPPDQRQ
jgi:hypothetical protein